MHIFKEIHNNKLQYKYYILYIYIKHKQLYATVDTVAISILVIMNMYKQVRYVIITTP